jgi:hypothetical protein
MTATSAAVLVAALSGCALGAPAATVSVPSPSTTPSSAPTDSGPVDAVTTAYQSAVAGGFSDQLTFFGCVYGGSGANKFTNLFAGLSVLALSESGVDPGEFQSAFGTSFDHFSATELSRGANTATVELSVDVSLRPDLPKLRLLLHGRQSSSAAPTATDDPAIEAALQALLANATTPTPVRGHLNVTYQGGHWVACA